MVLFYPVPFCTTVPFCPNMPCYILPPRLRLEKTHYVNYDIARCSIKWCEIAIKRYIIIFNHRRRYYYLICQSTWCQNTTKFIYQKGEISFFVIYSKRGILQVWFRCVTLDWPNTEIKWTRKEPCLACFWFFFKTPGHFAPMFHFAPTCYISTPALTHAAALTSLFKL